MKMTQSRANRQDRDCRSEKPLLPGKKRKRPPSKCVEVANIRDEWKSSTRKVVNGSESVNRGNGK
jgi:hypothetical protein